MPIGVGCDFCGKKLTVKDELAGRKVKCPDCGGHVDIPRAEDPFERPAGPKSRGKAKPKPQRRDAFEDDDDDDDGDSPDIGGLLRVGGIALGGLFLVAIVIVVFLSQRSGPAVANNPPPAPPQRVAPAPPLMPGNPFNVPADNPANGNFNPPRFQGAKPEQRANANDLAVNPPQVAAGPRPQRPAAPVRREPPRLKSANWTGQPDPQQDRPTLQAPQGISFRGGRGGAGRDNVVFPYSLSNYVAIGSGSITNEIMRVYDLQTGQAIQATLRVQLRDPEQGALSSDGRYFAAKPVFDQKILLYDLKKPAQPQAVPHRDEVRFLKFGGSTRLVALTSDEAIAWPIPNGQPEIRIPLDTMVFPKEKVAVSHGGKYLAWFHDKGLDAELTVFDLDTGRSVGELPLPDNGTPFAPECEALAFSPDGTELVARMQAHTTHMLAAWNMNDGSVTAAFTLDDLRRQIQTGSIHYHAPPLEVFPDGKHWLLGGELVVSRDDQQVSFQVPGLKGILDNHVTKVLPNGHLALARSRETFGPMSVELVEVP